MKKLTIAACTTMLFVTASAQAPRGPRVQPDAVMTLYAPNQHELYDGDFVIRGTGIYQAGKLNDASPWDHMGDDAKKRNPANHPDRQVFDHFFAMEVTWQ